MRQRGPQLTPARAYTAPSMAGAGLAFALGVVLAHLPPSLPPFWLVTLLLLVCALLAWRLPWARVAFFLCLGAFWALTHLTLLLSASFPDDLLRVPLIVEGRVASIPTATRYGGRFNLRIEHTERDGQPLAFRGLVRLSCYRDCPTVRAGERWRVLVRLKPRHGYTNPGGVDYERWLFEQGIQATGHLLRPASAERLDAGAGRDWLTRWRQVLAEHLAHSLGDDAPGLGLIQALTIGERSKLDPALWEALTGTGTNHLVAISGLHVGLVAGGVLVLVRRLWAGSVGAIHLMAAPRAAAIAGALAALGYAGLAGFSVSTQRALIMLAVVLGALFLQRTLRPYHALVLALVAVLVWDPLAVLAYGFWLSFGAVAVLLFNLGQRLPNRQLWTRWGRAQWAVGLGLLPLLLLFFGQASLVAPLVNLVAVPVFSLVLLPLVLVSSLLSFIPGLVWPLEQTAALLDWCVSGLSWIAAQPWAAGQLPARPTWVWVAAFLGVGLLLAPRGLPGRWLGLIMLLPLVAVRAPLPAPGEAWFTLLDVGQGLSAVVQTRAGTLVYDTGPGYPSGFNTGERVLVPFLKAAGIERIDRLVISHADRDHAGGIVGLLGAVAIGSVQSGEPGELKLLTADFCQAGTGWDWSGVRFRFLYPDDAGEEGNNASCVLRIATDGAAILLTGDVDTRIERALVARFGAALRAEILVAGHHGSATSTASQFLQAVAPDWVLFASGYGNQFGFPVAEVVDRVAAFGSDMMSTASAGAIELRLGPQGLIAGPRSWRAHSARLWTHRPDDPALIKP